MLDVVETRTMPSALNMTEWAKQDVELLSAGEREVYLRRSEHAWILSEDGYTLMLVGVYKPVLVGPDAELWIVLCEEFNHRLRRNLLLVRDKFEELLEMYPLLRVRIDAQFPAGSKFAKFFGFVKLELAPQLIRGREYLVYEVRR